MCRRGFVHRNYKIGRPLVFYIRSPAKLSVNQRRTVFSAIGALCMSLYISASVAQIATGDKSAPEAASSTGTLAEIVVTAERRAGTVQSTPISITAVTGEELQAQGTSSASEVGYETPGVSEHNSGPGQTEYEMRGISSAGGTSPTVGFYLDDVPLTPAAQSLEGKVVIDPNLYDLNRVEVLRGPQGTLYGSGSMGGTIRLITNQPNTHEFGASGQLTSSDTLDGGPNYGANVMLNLPVINDQLAVRIVGTDAYTDGWIDRIVVNPFPLPGAGGFARGNVLAAPVVADHHDVNWERQQGIRGSVLWQPTEGLSVSPTVMYQKTTQGSPNYVDVPPAISDEAHYQPFDVSEPYSDTFTLYTLPIKYDLGPVELASITAHYDRNSHLTQDSSEIGQDFLEALIGIPDVSYATAGPLTSYEIDHTGQTSQEVRLSSTGSGPLQWVIGGFYEDYDAHTLIGTSTPGTAAQALLTSLFGGPSYFNLAFQNTLKQYAGFGEASYQMGPLRATAGLRYYSYQQNEDLTQGGGLVTGGGPPTFSVIPSSAHGVNPKYNLAYEPNRDLTVYAEVAKGFRPGGVNSPAPVTCPKNALQYNPDSLWSYELGEKARTLGDRLIVNSSVYFEDWTNIQQLFTEKCGVVVTSNAGTAHVYGGELETNARITREFTLSNGLALTHAFIADSPAGSAFTTGEQVQNVPSVTDTTSVTYTRLILSNYEIVFRASNVYTGNSTDPSFMPITKVPSRDIGNLRLGLVEDNGMSVYLFVDNVTDKRAYLNDPEEIFTFVPSTDRVTTNQPRTIGLQLSYATGGR
jgi:iron complex outermembrane recepter protein